MIQDIGHLQATSGPKKLGNFSRLTFPAIKTTEYKSPFYGAGHPIIGTVLMLFFGLPSITRSL